MSGPYQGRDLSNCGVGRLRVAINCGVLSVKLCKFLYLLYTGFHTGFSGGGTCCVWVNWDGRVLFPGHAQKWC